MSAKDTVAQQTLTKEDALARGAMLIQEIRAILKTRTPPKKPISLDKDEHGYGSYKRGEGPDSTDHEKKIAAIDRQRDEFHALVKQGEQREATHEQMRTEMKTAWQKWVKDITDRPRPLKAEGAAAKKLDSYKDAKALEDQFHEQYDKDREASRAANEQAREMLKVPVEDRSSLTFRHDGTLSPMVVSGAAKALSMIRAVDGSGAFIPAKIPADQIDKVRAVFGDKTTLAQNPDGTYSLPSVLRVGKSTDGRAHATLDGIMLGNSVRELDHSVYHEVAHHIEMNNRRVLRAAVDLRESLASTPREVYKLNTVKPSLGDDEVAVRGNFPDPYVGKLYRTKQDEDVATEIVSTGVESYLTDPVHFARTRPEHFNFIFDVMHGKYR